MIDSVYRREIDPRGYRLSGDDADQDRQWKAIEANVAKLDIRWNRDKACYTFKDGSHLPEPIQKLYRRQIWKVDGLNGEAELILERMDNKYVQVNLHWSGKKDQPMPPFVLSLFAVNDKDNTLAELGPVSIGSWAGDQAFSSQTFKIEVAEGAEVQARLTIGKREQVSPVYIP